MAYVDGSTGWCVWLNPPAANPSYDPSMQPYIDAANFADHIEPFFYALASPLDIPTPQLVQKLGGAAVQRLAQLRVGNFIRGLETTVGASNVTKVTAGYANSVMQTAADAAATPAAALNSAAYEFVVTDAFNATYPSMMSRVSTTAAGAQAGQYWTFTSTITDAVGAYLDPAEISDILALPYTPSYVARLQYVTPGTKGLISIIGRNFGKEGNGIQVWFPLNSFIAYEAKTL